MKSSLKSIAALAALVLAGGAASGANAALLYSQPWDLGTNAYSSQNDTNGGGFGNFATVYDDFTLGGTSTITGIGFTGQYYNPPIPGVITGFTVNIYADAAGQPGASLYNEFVSGNGAESAFNCGGSPCADYSLGANFTAVGGTTYWLSVVPDLGFPPQWGWESGTGGNGVAYQDFFGTRSQLSTDMAFSLTGAAAGVPEPATWGLMLVGFGGLGAMMRKRRRVAFARI